MKTRIAILVSLTLSLLLPVAAQDFEFFPGAVYDPAVPTLERVVGHRWASRVTTHGEAERYLWALAETSPKVELVRFGETWEGRAQYYLLVSSPENLARKQDVRLGMQRLADPRSLEPAQAEELISTLPAVVWLSYGIHGNEISSPDAALLTAYHLAAARNDPMVDQILQNTVVILDPMQNPDGRDRFITYFRQTRGPEPDADPQAAEHNEVWPGGRTNHYLFDMNRDWFALTQVESRNRVRAFLDWYPVVFADLHEMGSNSTYYFPPTADPVSPHITNEQAEWIRRFGQNNSRWFDRFRFDYFTREVFDAFYPGYGVSWPSMHGAIGMTYEQASVRGLAVERDDETTLLFRDSVQHHFIASLSTAEVVAGNRAEMLRYLYHYRRMTQEEFQKLPVKFFLFPPGRDPNRTRKLMDVLEAQGVEVLEAPQPISVARARTPGAAAWEQKELPAGTFVLSLFQPAHRLLRTLLEREMPMDEEFLQEQIRRNEKRESDQIYDVTAWSLPLLYDVEVYEADTAPQGALSPRTAEAPVGAVHGEEAYLAYLIPWGTNSAARALGDLLRQGVRVHSADRAFTLNEKRFPAGSLIVKVKDNPTDLADRLAAVAEVHGVEIHATDRAWVSEGINLGSNNVRFLEPPRIALAWNDPTNSYSAGWARYLLEQAYGLPVTAIRTSQLARADLSKYNVLILPNTRGSGEAYGETLGQAGLSNLKTWVRQGGTLITIGNATHWLTDEKVGLLATQRELRGGRLERDKAPEKKDDPQAEPSLEPDRELPPATPGAILRVTVDSEHWLGFGYDHGTTNVLVESRNIFRPLKLDQGTNVARYAAEEELLAGGFTWEAARKQLPRKAFLMHQGVGQGNIVAFAEDPNYRAYFDGLNLLFLNGVFFGPAH